MATQDFLVEMKGTKMSALASIEITSLPVDQLEPNGWNFNEMTDEALAEYVDEVKHLGCIPKPIVVRPHGDKFQIVDGEHAWHAASEVGLTEVPCEVTEMTEFEAMRQTYKRNRGGTDNPLKLGFMFKRMMASEELSQRALAKRVGISDVTIGNYLTYVKACELRNCFAASMPEVSPEIDLVGPSARVIASLGVRQVDAYLKMPQELRDTWLDAGADLASVRQFLGNSADESLEDLVRYNLHHAVSIFPKKFRRSLKRAFEYLSWVKEHASVQDLADYALPAAERDLVVEVLDCLPVEKDVSPGCIVIPLDDWVEVVDTCQGLEFRGEHQCDYVHDRVAEFLEQEGVDPEGVSNPATIEKKQAVEQGPDFIRNSDSLSLDEKFWLLEATGDASDGVVTRAQQMACEIVTQRRREEVSCKDRVSTVFYEALRVAKKQKTILDLEEFLEADDGRRIVTELLTDTNAIETAEAEGKPASKLLTEQINQMGEPEYAMLVGALTPNRAEVVASLWLKVISSRMKETPIGGQSIA